MLTADNLLGGLQLLSGFGLALLVHRILREMPAGWLKFCLCGVLALGALTSLESALVNLRMLDLPDAVLVAQRYVFAGLGIACGLVSAGVLKNS